MLGLQILDLIIFSKATMKSGDTAFSGSQAMGNKLQIFFCSPICLHLIFSFQRLIKMHLFLVTINRASDYDTDLYFFA